MPPRPLAGDGFATGILDRLRDWRADPRAGVAGLVIVALLVGFVWYRMGIAGGSDDPAPTVDPAAVDPAATDPAATDPASDVEAPAGAAPASEVVTGHGAGAVTTPGVMELPGGSRVIDAVEAAGGGLPEADLDRLNLAAPLADGQRIDVQRVGDPPPVADPASGTGGSAPAGDGTTAPGLVNVNTATPAELETLPGIGPTLAEAIIDERERRGGFRSVNELRDVRGIGEQRFADIKDLVTV